MDKRTSFICRTLVFIALFVVLTVVATNIAGALLERGYNVIVVALPLSLLFFGLGCWFVE